MYNIQYQEFINPRGAYELLIIHVYPFRFEFVVNLRTF